MLLAGRPWSLCVDASCREEAAATPHQPETKPSQCISSCRKRLPAVAAMVGVDAGYGPCGAAAAVRHCERLRLVNFKYLRHQPSQRNRRPANAEIVPQCRDQVSFRVGSKKELTLVQDSSTARVLPYQCLCTASSKLNLEICLKGSRHPSLCCQDEPQEPVHGCCTVKATHRRS